MSTEPVPAATNAGAEETNTEHTGRKGSFSQQSITSNDSQTAAEFIRSQELLEADAREALPYSIENCTNILGPLRQNVFACLTCNPPPATSSDPWTPAGVCYACSVQCHGEHTLVEIFQKRNFTCDCGTKRMPATSPCTLRTNTETNLKGGVHSEEPDANNKYNQNFKNRFCGCECDYDPFQQKGTMFQCLGLGTAETGGCGEDWFHPGCLVGMGPKWYEKMERTANSTKSSEGASSELKGDLGTIKEDAEAEEGVPAPEEKPKENDETAIEDDDEDEPPMPPGFPSEESFEGFLCYKCVESNPWIKHYAGTSGFLPPLFLDGSKNVPLPVDDTVVKGEAQEAEEQDGTVPKKRKADDDDSTEQSGVKHVKSEDVFSHSQPVASTDIHEGTSESVASLPCKLPNLANHPPSEPFSLFFMEDFRDRLCRCSACFPRLNAHPQLLEEEEVYEPPMSDAGGSEHGGSTHGSGSLLERGESALRNVDRVRAIEGVMAYQHLKERLKPFFQQFAESGQAVGAEDIKEYFAKLRGDEEGMREAAAEVKGEGEADHRREQGGQ